MGTPTTRKNSVRVPATPWGSASGPSLDRIARTQADYDRLRTAYLAVLQRDPPHEVALAMLGSDLDRIHRQLQALLGLPPRPYAPGPSVLLRRERSGPGARTSERS